MNGHGELVKRYGPWALVTGAAHGLGRAFAELLAAAGFDLLLVDVDGEANETLADRLRARSGVEVRALVLDVGRAELAERAAELARDHDIGVLINNVGIGPVGRFLQRELDEHLRTVDINCKATLVLTHVIGRRMVARGRGAIVIVSSGSALTGSPRVANYAATKGYGLNLAAALSDELGPSGVDVIALCPGLLRTRATELRPPKTDAAPLVTMHEPEPVARAALDALVAGRGPLVVPGALEKLSWHVLGRLAPRKLLLRMLGATMDKLYPDGGD